MRVKGDFFAPSRPCRACSSVGGGALSLGTTPWKALCSVIGASGIVASANGVVRHASRLGSYGLVVEVNHGYGYVTRYAHMQSIAVRVGQRVERGEMVDRFASELMLEILKGRRRRVRLAKKLPVKSKSCSALARRKSSRSPYRLNPVTARRSLSASSIMTWRQCAS